MIQEAKVLDYLIHHEGITSLEAVYKLDITRLSAVIYNIKAKGGEISKIRENHTNRKGETTSYDRYFVNNKEELLKQYYDEMIEENMNHIPRID